jgi:uncharacterized membrane protein YedE/YeeE
VTAREMTIDAALTAFMGVVLGFCLSRIGFASWDEVHAMFTFTSLRLFLTFAIGVSILAIGWRIVAMRSTVKWPTRPVHRGTVLGGILFGVGWALSGACPAIALVQLGEGQLGAIWTLAGILIGNGLYAEVHARWLRWPTGSCLDE